MNAVHDIMSTSPVTVQASTSVGELLVLFDRYDFNAFPVLDERERLLGIVSKLHVLQLFMAYHELSSSVTDSIDVIRVAEIMRHDAICVEAHDSIPAAGNLMVTKKLRSLPVVGQRSKHPVPVGMLSRGDVLRWLRFQLAEGRYARQEKAS
jgi:CBS domain-containing protein